MHLLLSHLVALLAGCILGYAFRGKAHAAIAAAGSEVKAVESDVKKHL
jgi:hypothetical protein